jgi:hypothetical protein
MNFEMSKLAFVYEVLKKYRGKYQSWKLVNIACLGEHIKITFNDDFKLIIPVRRLNQSHIDNLPNVTI